MDCGLGSIIFLVYGEKTLVFFCGYVFRFNGFKVDTVFYLRFGDIDCFFLFQGKQNGFEQPTPLNLNINL